MPRPRSRIATHDPAAIRARLRALVDDDDRTQRELADAAGMAPTQLSHVLTGHRPDPSARSVGRILAALGLPWSALDG